MVEEQLGKISPGERVRMLLEAERDSWIAMSSDESKIVAAASTFEEVVKRAEENGENDPVILKTPKEWIPLVL